MSQKQYGFGGFYRLVTCGNVLCWNDLTHIKASGTVVEYIEFSFFVNTTTTTRFSMEETNHVVMSKKLFFSHFQNVLVYNNLPIILNAFAFTNFFLLFFVTFRFFETFFKESMLFFSSFPIELTWLVWIYLFSNSPSVSINQLIYFNQFLEFHCKKKD